MYKKDIILVPARGLGNDVFLERGFIGGSADVYMYAAAGIGNDVFARRQRYDTAEVVEVPPPPEPSGLLLRMLMGAGL